MKGRLIPKHWDWEELKLKLTTGSETVHINIIGNRTISELIRGNYGIIISTYCSEGFIV